MDINLLFEAGMISCGRVLRVLPKEEIGTPIDYMMKVLRILTLPSLNIIFPRLYTTTFGINKLKLVSSSIENLEPKLQQQIQVDGAYTFYRVPKEITEGQDIVLIKSCTPLTSCPAIASSGSPMYGDTSLSYIRTSMRGYDRYSSANLYEGVAYSQINYADRQLAGQVTSAFRYKFYPPNILAIINGYSGDNLILRTEFGLKNDESLLSVEDTAYESVRELFTLDLKSTIYNEYGIFGSIETPSGTVDLKIDDWSSCEGERSEKYKEYLATSHFRTSTMRTG